jgi:sec-independent protein translocase protein TatA
MHIGGMGTMELLVILAVALLIFGPKNLPKLGAAIGKTVKNIRSGMDSVNKDEETDKQSSATVESVENQDKGEDASA